MDIIYYEAYGNLYLNLTNRCTANCIFCVRNFSKGVYGYDLTLSKEPSTEWLIEALGKLDLSKYGEIVFTGFGEPTLRFDTVLEVIRWLKARPGKIKVRLDTNGHAALINPERAVARELRNVGLDVVSVSLNAESEEIYNKLCKPEYENAYQAVLDFIGAVRKAGVPVRVTVVKLPEIDIEKCRKIAEKLGAEFFVRKFSETAREG